MVLPRHSAANLINSLPIPVAGSQQWSTIIQHRWRFKQHINALELRSILLALIWITSCKHAGHRILLF